MKLKMLLSLVLMLLVAGVVSADSKTEDGSSRVVLAVSGMHCGSCADGITAMLKRTEGVLEVSTSFEDRESKVRFDPAVTSPAKLIEAIEKLGYKASVKPEGGPGDQK